MGGPSSSSTPSSAASRSPTSSLPALVVLPCADPLELIQRPARTPLRGRVLYFSAELLAALKEQARQELLEAGNAAGAAALTRFQTLGSLMWRCVTRAQRLVPDHVSVFRVAVNNRRWLRPALPREYFGNRIHVVSIESARSSDLLGHGGHGRRQRPWSARWWRTRTRPSGSTSRRGRQARQGTMLVGGGGVALGFNGRRVAAREKKISIDLAKGVARGARY